MDYSVKKITTMSAQALRFKNFTDEDFTWSFDSVPHTFKAGETMFLESFKAAHFAKHLVDRELNRMGLSTSHILKRNELTALCYPSDEVVTPLEALQVNSKEEMKKPDVEEEFEDLEDVSVEKEEKLDDAPEDEEVIASPPVERVKRKYTKRTV